VAEVVREQVRTGLDIINDGEFGKSIWMWYATDRLTGFERRPYASQLLAGRDQEQFREFYAYAERTSGTLFQEMDKVTIDTFATQPVCVGPVTYKPDDIRRDLATRPSSTPAFKFKSTTSGYPPCGIARATSIWRPIGSSAPGESSLSTTL
jgi:methionine synthase II (cobalamin-independent)